MKNMLLKALLGLVGPLLLQIINTVVNKGVLDQAVQLAGAEVERLGRDTTKTDDEKRKAAVENVKTQMRSVGVEATTSVLNLAIELAVQGLKSKLAA